MQCEICKKEYEQKHFNQRYCSDECKKVARANTVKKYKQSKKGIATRKRWYKNPKRQEIENRYRSKPRSKKFAVKRTTRYYKRHPEKKKQRDKKYGYSRRGYNAGYIDWEKVNGLPDICCKCGSDEDITIDHIKPLSKGGTNDIKNLQKLCRRCNASKGNKWNIPVSVDTHLNTKRKI